MFLAKLILGPIMIGIGILMMKYTVQITDTVGKIGFAERIFAPPLAGTYTWWRLLGFVLIAISVLWMTDYISFFALPTITPQ